jgi:hypothetical protein
VLRYAVVARSLNAGGSQYLFGGRSNLNEVLPLLLVSACSEVIRATAHAVEVEGTTDFNRFPQRSTPLLPKQMRGAFLAPKVPTSNPASSVSAVGYVQEGIPYGTAGLGDPAWHRGSPCSRSDALLPVSANVKAAREHLTILRKPVISVGRRPLIQMVFIAALIASVWPRR